MAKEERIQLSIHPEAFWFAKKPIFGKPYIRLSAFRKNSYVELKYDDENKWEEDIDKFRKLAIFLNKRTGIDYITTEEKKHMQSHDFLELCSLIEGDLTLEKVIPDLSLTIEHNPNKFDFCNLIKGKKFGKYTVTIDFAKREFFVFGKDDHNKFNTVSIKVSNNDARLLKILLRAKYLTTLSLVTRTVNFNCLRMRNAVDDALSTGNLKEI